MPEYTTGEVARLCKVSVRTVQYYDARGILVPSDLSEGGRRLYSENDVRKMKVICFLRDLGLPISSISQLLAEKEPEKVISLLLDQQETQLKSEINEREEMLKQLSELKNNLKNYREFSVDSIGDIAYIMTNKKELRRIHLFLLLIALPSTILECSAIYLWITKGIRWLFIVWLLLCIPYAIYITRWYFRKVAYICPECHEVFKPSFKEAFWARHTPATRKLTCPKCGHHGFCVEVAASEGGKSNEYV